MAILLTPYPDSTCPASTMRTTPRKLSLEQFEPRQLLANVYDTATDPAVGAVVTAFLENDPADPNDSWDIETNWKRAASELASVGADEITFAVYRAVDGNGNIFGGPSNQVVASAVQHASQAGLSVTVLPVFEVEGLGWRGEYNPNGAARGRFQTEYSNWIRNLASIPNVNRLNIGSELNAMVEDSSNRNFFEGVIQTARGAGFSGQLGYAANFDAYNSPGHQAIWQNPEVQYIGISAYFSLIEPSQASQVASTGNVSNSAFNTMVQSWNQQLDQLEQFASSANLPVVLQEFGATQRNYSTVFPWAVVPGEHLSGQPQLFAEDKAEQEAAYRSLLTALDGRNDAFDSVFFWAWEHGSDRGERFYEDVDPSVNRYINEFAIWPTDGGAGQYLADFLKTQTNSNQSANSNSTQTGSDTVVSRNLGTIDLTSLESSSSDTIVFRAQRSGLVTVVATGRSVGDALPTLELYNSAGELLATDNSGDPRRVDAAVSGGEELTLKVSGPYRATIANILSITSNNSLHINGTNDADHFLFSAAKPANNYTHYLAATANPSVDYSFSPNTFSNFLFLGSRGTDSLVLQDSHRDDFFQSYPLGGRLSDTDQSYFVSALGFEQVSAFATAGGVDQASFQDSQGDDHFYADHELALLNVLGGTSANAAVGFEHNTATSSGESGDVAILRDGPGNDHLSAELSRTEFELGQGTTNSAADFQTVHATSAAGFDSVQFGDSASDDLFYVDPSQALLQGNGQLIFAGQFDSVTAIASSGNDTAILQGGPNEESFLVDNIAATLSDGDYVHRVIGYNNTFAYASDDQDTITFIDTEAHDQFVVTPAFSSMSSTSYANYATGFSNVRALANRGGIDSAFLYDSPDSDRLIAIGGTLSFELAHQSDNTKDHTATGFDVVYASSKSAAVDFLIASDPEFQLEVLGNWS